MSDDDSTDDRFKIEDQERKIAQEMFSATASKRLDIAKTEYAGTKDSVSELVSENGNDREKLLLSDLTGTVKNW